MNGGRTALEITTPSGIVAYATARRRGDGQMWRHASGTVAPFGPGESVADFAIPLADVGGDHHSAPIPFPAGTWRVVYYQLEGALAADDDLILGGEILFFNGVVAGEFDPAPPLVYMGVEESTILAASVPGLEAFKAADDVEKLARLAVATARVDSRRYQGRKYDPSQPLEFPRIPRASSVWDWDPTANGGAGAGAGAAVAPYRVKLAVLYEADAVGGEHDSRMRAIADGLASQSVGALSETYRATAAVEARDLSNEAETLLRRYLITSGGLL